MVENNLRFSFLSIYLHNILIEHSVLAVLVFRFSKSFILVFFFSIYIAFSVLK